VVLGDDFTNSLIDVGTDGADKILGDYNANRLAGQEGNDTIYGLGGEDIIRGGEGNDTIGITDLDFELIDGGTGNDTLEFIGNGIDLDTTGFAGSSLRSFETIDITGNGANSLNMNFIEVVYLLERQLTEAYEGPVVLTIEGSTGADSSDDTLTLEGPWSLFDSTNANYDTYMLDGIAVKVDNTIAVTVDDWTIPYQGATIDLNAESLPEGLRIDTFTSATNVSGNNGVLSQNTYIIALGDVNGDGLADYGIADYDVNSSSLYWHNRDRTKDNNYTNNYDTNDGGWTSSDERTYNSVDYNYYVTEQSTTIYNGEVFIIYGSSGGHGEIKLTDYTSDQALNIVGSGSDNEKFGSSMSSLGDIDGDGTLDFIVNAPTYSSTLTFTEGGEESLNDLTGGTGYVGGDAAGTYTYSYGPITQNYPFSTPSQYSEKDNLDDWSKDEWSESLNGRQYLFLGSNSYLSTTNAKEVDVTSTTLTNNENNSNSLPTEYELSSDVNYELPDRGSESGGVTTFTYSTNSSIADAVYTGSSNEQLGSNWDPIALGDINGDGYGDFIQNNSGGYIYLGGDIAAGNLGSSRTSSEVPWSETVSVDSTWESITKLGDVDGDGFDDFLLQDDGSDIVYIVHGGDSTWTTFSTSNTHAASDTAPAVTRIFSEPDFNTNGAYSPLGDINGDGFMDILISASHLDDINALNNGAAYVIFGSDDGRWDSDMSLVDLAAKGQGFRIEGAVDKDFLNQYSWTGVGDMNGDGYDDFIVQASGDDEAANGSGGGSSYLILGRKTSEWGDFTTLQVQDYGIQILGSGTDYWTALGDIDGDGLDDVALSGSASAKILYGSTNYSETQTDAWSLLGSGTAMVQYAVDDGQNLTATRGDAVSAILGQDRLIGDLRDNILTGDGGSDVLIGGAGDDVLVAADNNFFKLDGGEGVDTLYLEGSGTINLADRLSANIDSIEMISTTQYDGSTDVATTLILSAGDVRQIASNTNTFVDNATYQTGNTLIIELGDNDELDLRGDNWSYVATTTISSSASTYYVYQDGTNNTYVVTNKNLVGDMIHGTAEADTLTGTGVAEAIFGLAGNDSIDAGADNDTIHDGTGTDSLIGGSGNDIFVMELDGEADTVIGGNGFDLIDLSAMTTPFEIEYMVGGNYSNEKNYTNSELGTLTTSYITGFILGSGDDQILNSQYGVYLDGGDGNDRLEVRDVDTYAKHADTIYGGNGNDTILSWYGDDYIEGGDGNDSINASSGDDTVYGGNGDDNIQGGTGEQYIDGGAGNDTIKTFETGLIGDTVDGGTGDDVMLISSWSTGNINTDTNVFTAVATDRQSSYNGGDGADIVLFTNNNSTVTNKDYVYDFSAHPNTTFSGIEYFKLDTANQRVKLSGEDVSSITTAGNSFVANTSYNGEKILIIDSTADLDSLELTGGHWSAVTDTTAVNGSTDSFSIYKYDYAGTVVYVATDMTATLS